MFCQAVEFILSYLDHKIHLFDTLREEIRLFPPKRVFPLILAEAAVTGRGFCGDFSGGGGGQGVVLTGGFDPGLQ